MVGNSNKMSLLVMPTNQLECARIYIDPKNRSNFTFKCFYCYRDYSHFDQFVRHLQLRHTELEEAYHRSKMAWQRETNETELVLIEEHDVSHYVSISSDSGRAESREVVEETTGIRTNDDEDAMSSMVDFKIEIMDENTRENNFLDDDDDFAVQIDSIENSEMELKQCDNTSAGAMQSSPEHKLSTLCNLDRNKSTEEKSTEKKHSESERLANATEPKRTGIFYSLRDTDSKIMLDFIDMIREHPCHWNPVDPNNDIKKKREESSKLICERLLQKYNIHITPSVARTSVLQLCRWYESEYLRLVDSIEKNRPYICTHPEYYGKLHAFLPHLHLKMLSCGKCPRTFKTEPLLLVHKHTAHQEPVPYKCATCGRGFVHLSSYLHHGNRHTRKRVWPCEICEYRAATKSDLQMHLTTHSNKKPFICDLCGAAYKSSTSLNVHKRSHGPANLKCEYCGKKFHENYRLKRHVESHESKKRGTFKCAMCAQHFTCRNVLKQHQKQHEEAMVKERGAEYINHQHQSDEDTTEYDYQYLESDDDKQHVGDDMIDDDTDDLESLTCKG